MISIEHDALKRFVKATEEFESRFGNVMTGLSGPRSQTGEFYSEYFNGNPSPDNPDEKFPSPDGAIEHTFERLTAHHPANQSATLHWRIKPEIVYSDHRKGFITYCRFLVTEKKLRTDG